MGVGRVKPIGSRRLLPQKMKEKKTKMDAGNQKQHRRKRIPVIMAGSALRRGLYKPPQAPPKSPKPKKVKLPKCQHGCILTLEEFLYQTQAKDEGRDAGFWFVTECPGCFPDCIHEYKELTPGEIASGKRWSAQCPGCNGPAFAEKETWDAFLKFWGQSAYRAMSPAKYTLELKNGKTMIIGQQKNYCTGGGSKDMEQTDANSKSRGDLQAKSKAPKGSGTETYADEQNKVNELNEPVSPVPSTFVEKAEHIKSSEITSAIKGSLVDPNEEVKEAPKEARPENPLETVKPDMPGAEAETELKGMKKLKLTRKENILLNEIRTDIAVGGQE
jgi:hypothetical protein